MNIGNITNAVTRCGHRGVLVTKKYSPQILTGVGIVSGIASTVLASKATLQLEDKIDDMRKHVENANNLLDRKSITEQEHRKEVAYIYLRSSLAIGKLYAPAASVGVAGIACVISAQGIMQRRNAALTAAYVALEKGFNEYRKRVETALGEDEELKLRYGITEEEIHDTEKGEVRTVQKADPNAVSIYAKFFDEGNPNWTKTPEYNMLFIKSQQNYANDLLHSRGHVFLNDVYDMLGIERTRAGAVVGWVLSKDGDNYIDFGLYRGDSERVREFVNGYERSILLDFNVDGVVLDKIAE